MKNIVLTSTLADPRKVEGIQCGNEAMFPVHQKVGEFFYPGLARVTQNTYIIR